MPPSTTPRIVVLFSGGDAPGMNPCLRALVRLGLNLHDADVLGVRDGYGGLVRACAAIQCGESSVAALREEIDAHPGRAGLWRREQALVRLDRESVGGLTGRGGSVLGAGRCRQFLDPDVRRQAIDLLDELGVTAAVVCGGNGSLAGAACLAAESGLHVIGVPATIDNDLPHTETALGVDTAVNTLMWAVEHFSDTAGSHHRIMVLETMGRDCGELARLTALASGAEIVVTPERGPMDEVKRQGIAERLERSLLHGRTHAIALVAEGVRTDPPCEGSPAVALAQFLQTHFQRPGSPFPELETRASVLGHLQRGGRPTAADRLLAARFADAAWEALADPAHPGGVLGVRRGRVTLRPFGAGDGEVRQAEAECVYRMQKAVSRM